MRMSLCLAVMLSVSLCGGCATLLRGSHQTLSFQTVPPGAQLDIDGNIYYSPAKVDLQRKVAHTVIISKQGYRTLKFTLDPEWDGVSLVGNLILPGGSVGLIIDQADGADRNFYKLAKIDLIPSTQPAQRPLVLNDFKGHLLTSAQVRQAVIADRADHSQFFRGEP